MSWPQERKSGLQLAVGFDDGAGQLTVPGHLTVLGYSREKTFCACSRCGIGGLVFFSLLYPIFLSLGTWLDLTTMLLTGPLTMFKTPKQTNEWRNKQTVINSLKALMFLLNIINALK